MNEINNRFEKQLQFIIEIDKVKQIFRKTKLFDKSRFENDAEHSWHICLMALVLLEHANENVDLLKVLKMLLIHDLVEIDAGDVIIYDTINRQAANDKEIKAAERIFGLLPEDQKNEFYAIWEEFEKRVSAEAKYAAALDRFEPILQNKLTEYYTWQKHNINMSQLYEKNSHIKEGSNKIWDVVQTIFKDANKNGFIKE